MATCVEATILIISSSRPEVLWYCLKSFNERLLNCTKKYYINEDVVNPTKTKEIERIVGKLKLDATVIRNKEPIGPFISIMNFAQTCKSKYLFIIEDDWELEVDIRVDDLYRIMDKYPNINEILVKYKERLVKGEPNLVDFGYTLALSTTPMAMPALWRVKPLQDSFHNKQVHDLIYGTSFVRLRIPVVFPDFYHITSTMPEGDGKVKWLRDSIGAYVIQTEYAQIRHLGTTWKTFLPIDPSSILSTELEAKYITCRTPSLPPEARPINGKIPFDEKFVEEQCLKADTRISDYLYYIKSLYNAGSLKMPDWDAFLVKHRLK